MFHNIYHALIWVSQTMKPQNIHYKPPYQVQNLSMKIEKTTENWKQNRRRTDNCRMLGMSVIWVDVGTNRYDAYPKHQSRNPRRTGGKKTRKTIISFMHCPIIIINWEKKIFRHLQLSVVFFLFFLNCQWLNFLWWSHSLSLGKKCNLGLWLEWHLTL